MSENTVSRKEAFVARIKKNKKIIIAAAALAAAGTGLFVLSRSANDSELEVAFDNETPEEN